MVSHLLLTTTHNVPTASNASVTRPSPGISPRTVPRSPPFMTIVWGGRSGTHPPTLAGLWSDGEGSHCRAKRGGPDAGCEARAAYCFVALYHVLPVDSMIHLH
ncbi:hypothetical protein EXIGLDRAFT_733898 [Exidia glandulosa HHB12029]|uniref:Uncharacterized protein n=1 Tax=Exidia glandulosa HHB12029 TaxID=1314781 RepID=A0A165KAU9_EXIGL|nr:hypothetical protein EXIGLDRAFT_733898 [Exidia glandulosa HHB12029]